MPRITPEFSSVAQKLRTQRPLKTINL